MPGVQGARQETESRDGEWGSVPRGSRRPAPRPPSPRHVCGARVRRARSARHTTQGGASPSQSEHNAMHGPTKPFGRSVRGVAVLSVTSSPSSAILAPLCCVHFILSSPLAPSLPPLLTLRPYASFLALLLSLSPFPSLPFPSLCPRLSRALALRPYASAFSPLVPMPRLSRSLARPSSLCLCALPSSLYLLSRSSLWPPRPYASSLLLSLSTPSLP